MCKSANEKQADLFSGVLLAFTTKHVQKPVQQLAQGYSLWPSQALLRALNTTASWRVIAVPSCPTHYTVLPSKN